MLNLPIGWSNELSVVMWLWLVPFGAAFVVRERDEIRLDLIYSAVARRGRRRVMAVISAVALVALFALSLPAVHRLRDLHEGAEDRLSQDPLRLAVFDLRWSSSSP